MNISKSSSNDSVFASEKDGCPKHLKGLNNDLVPKSNEDN